MITDESKTSPGWGGWMRWLVNTGIGLLAASGSVIAFLQYINAPGPSPAPTPLSITVIPSTTTLRPDPTATQTSVPPTVVYETPTPPVPSATESVLSYWQNVSEGRYEEAWAQLSPAFRQTWHNNDYMDYLRGYQKMNLCSIMVSNVRLISQDRDSAVLQAHLTYYAGARCNSSEYDFELWLIYDSTGNTWLFDRNISKS